MGCLGVVFLWVYVCMHVKVCGCVDKSVGVGMCLRVYVCMYVWICACGCLRVYVGAYGGMGVWMCGYGVCLSLFMGYA